MFRRLVAAAVVAALGMAVFTVSATAGSAVTKMKFDLAHEVAAGDPLVGSVSLWTRDGSTWSPLDATVSIVVDGTEVDTLTTGTDGWAEISWPATVAEGSHVMKIVFEGDATKAQRAQGFQVTEAVTEAAPGTGTVPDAPTLSGLAGSGSILLTWTVPADGGSALLAYNIYRGTTFGDLTLYTTVPATQMSFSDVVSGQTFYHVTAVNAVGESAASNVVMAS